MEYAEAAEDLAEEQKRIKQQQNPHGRRKHR